MRHSIVTFSLLILSSCGLNCDLEYYKKISGVNLPKHLKVIECIDNAEYIAAAVLKIDKRDIQSFIDNNNLNRVPDDFKPDFWGTYFLKKENLAFPTTDHLYITTGRTKTNTWLFLLDKETGTIWAEVQYPDWGGTPP